MTDPESIDLLMPRVLHALRDMKCRLAEAEARSTDPHEPVVVVSTIRGAGAELLDACHRALADIGGATQTAIIVAVDDHVPRAAQFAAQLHSNALCVDVHGTVDALSYAAHLAIDGVARGRFPQAILAASGRVTVFKTQKSAFQDGNRVLAQAQDWDKATDVGRVDKNRIAAMIAEILGLRAANEIEWHVSCFEYGLDSVKAVEIRNRLQRETGFSLPLTLLFEYPTVDDLDEYLRTLRPQVTSIEIPLLPCDGPFPSSRGQLALWGIHTLDRDSCAYNLDCAITLDPEVSLEVLREAIRRTFEKHPILRSRFEEKDGELVQLIDPVPRDPLEIDCPPHAFDLTRGNLARFYVPLNGGVLRFVCHHIIADFVSIRVVFRDVQHFFAELAAGASNPIVPDYAFFHYVARERAMANSVRSELARAWNELLGADLPVWRPLGGRPRQPGMYRSGHQYGHAIDPGLAGQIRLSAKSMTATTHQFMFAAYALALMEASGQRDIIAGTTVSLRDSDAEQDAVGYFVNPLPVRFQYAVAMTWTQYFEAHRRGMIEILRLRALPFAALVEHLSPYRKPFVSPIFQTMFTWLAEDSSTKFELAYPFREEVLPAPHQAAGVTHDLVLMVRQSGDHFRCTWCYQQPLIQADEIEALARRYVEILNWLTTNPELPIALHAPAEREELVI